MNTAFKNDVMLKKINDLELEQLSKKIKPIVRVGKNGRRCYLEGISFGNVKEGNFFDWTHWKGFKITPISKGLMPLCVAEIPHSFATASFPRPRIKNIYEYIFNNFSEAGIEDIDSFEIIHMDVSKMGLARYPENTKKGEHVSIVRFYSKQ